MTADIIDPAALAKRIESALRDTAEYYSDMTAMELRVTAPEARALAALLRGVVWQPIETAQKDGRCVLLWMVHQNAKFSRDPVSEGWAGPVVAHWIDHNSGGWTWHGLCGVPKAWMPLPAPPLSTAKEG